MTILPITFPALHIAQILPKTSRVGCASSRKSYARSRSTGPAPGATCLTFLVVVEYVTTLIKFFIAHCALAAVVRPAARRVPAARKKRRGENRKRQISYSRYILFASPK